MKKGWEALRPRVLKRIKPSAALTRRAHAAARRLGERARAAARARRADIEPVLVGSLAKDTHLLPQPDIDLFLLFESGTTPAQLEKLGVSIGKSILQRPALRYAEHPYVHGRFGGFVFDVVPAYRIEAISGRLSAVDRSPFHTEYVRHNIEPAQNDEVRLLKQFLKGIGCYGAETAIGGFSGYLAELLVLKYGTFWDCLETLREASPPLLLAMEGSAPPLGGSLVFVDPVDPARNAAAAVSTEKLATFLRASGAFTAAPRLDFFWPRPIRPEPANQLRLHLSHRGVLGLQMPEPRVRPDAVAPHARRFAEKVARRLENLGFRVVRRMAEAVPAGGYLLLWEHEPIMLASTHRHPGPPATDADHSRRFLQKWQNHADAVDLPQVRDGRWVVTVRRTKRTPMELLGPDLANLLEGVEISAAQVKRLRFETGPELVGREGLRAPLTRFLHPRDPWEAGDEKMVQRRRK